VEIRRILQIEKMLVDMQMRVEELRLRVEEAW
jgi:hypothetical protein